jgi:hypothetical protein
VDLTWIAPPIILLSGAAASAALLRAIAKATQDAQGAHRRFRRLEDAMIPIRVETRRTRESVDRLHHR